MYQMRNYAALQMGALRCLRLRFLGRRLARARHCSRLFCSLCPPTHPYTSQSVSVYPTCHLPLRCRCRCIPPSRSSFSCACFSELPRPCACHFPPQLLPGFARPPTCCRLRSRLLFCVSCSVFQHCSRMYLPYFLVICFLVCFCASPYPSLSREPEADHRRSQHSPRIPPPPPPPPPPRGRNIAPQSRCVNLYSTNVLHAQPFTAKPGPFISERKRGDLCPRNAGAITMGPPTGNTVCNAWPARGAEGAASNPPE